MQPSFEWQTEIKDKWQKARKSSGKSNGRFLEEIGAKQEMHF